MKTILLPLVGLVFLLLAGSAGVRATEPDIVRAARSAKTGRVLVLVNERTMEGEVTRIGEQYRIRRAVGETLVPADRVLFLCSSMTEALACLRRQANLDDADERLRLADWCRVHGLRRQALEEIQVAAQLRPDDEAIRRLLDHLVKSPLPPAPVSVQPVKHEVLAAAPTTLSEECLGSFATRVQPVLMNACASCHVTDKGGSFHLVRAYEMGIGDRRITQHNLSAVLAQVNPSRPEASPLLVRSVSIHGPMTQAPLRSRQSPAFQRMEEWVRKTIADNPQLVEPAGSAPAATDKPAAQTRPLPEVEPAVHHTPAGEGSQWGADAPVKNPPPSEPSPVPPAATAPPMSSVPLPAVPPRPAADTPPAAPEGHAEDPYDPELFNRSTPPSPKP